MPPHDFITNLLVLIFLQEAQEIRFTEMLPKIPALIILEVIRLFIDKAVILINPFLNRSRLL